MSTRAGKHFQRDVTRGVEGMVSTSMKQLEVATKLAEECRKYGMEGPRIGSPLARAAMQYDAARLQMDAWQLTKMLDSWQTSIKPSAKRRRFKLRKSAKEWRGRRRQQDLTLRTHSNSKSRSKSWVSFRHPWQFLAMKPQLQWQW